MDKTQRDIRDALSATKGFPILRSFTERFLEKPFDVGITIGPLVGEPLSKAAVFQKLSSVWKDIALDKNLSEAELQKKDPIFFSFMHGENQVARGEVLPPPKPQGVVHPEVAKLIG